MGCWFRLGMQAVFRFFVLLLGRGGIHVFWYHPPLPWLISLVGNGWMCYKWRAAGYKAVLGGLLLKRGGPKTWVTVQLGSTFRKRSFYLCFHRQ